jgi:hypothetical protein
MFDNRANSVQFQLKLPTGAELGKITFIEKQAEAELCKASQLTLPNTETLLPS